MNDPERDSQLESYFDSLRTKPVRDPVRAAEGKAAFLHDARILRAGVSERSVSRLNRRPFVGKERNAMIKIAGAVLLALAMTFGGGGAAVAAAQTSMPDEPLFPVKWWSEDALLAVYGESHGVLEYAIQFADRRAEEIIHQVDAGLPVEDGLLTRLMDQEQLSLRIAAGLEDQAAVAALTKLRDRLEVHARVLAYAGQGRGPVDQALLQQTRETVRRRLELLGENVGDQKVREQISEQNKAGQQKGGSDSQSPGEGQGEGGQGNGPGGQGYQGDGTDGSPMTCSCAAYPGKGKGAGQGEECVCNGTPQAGGNESGYGPP